MVKIGSHNSWTFSPLKKWYIPSFIVRCQGVDIQKQYVAGARLFDLRLRLDKYDQWGVSHGPIFFKTNFLQDLSWLNSLAWVKKENIYVRILLEYNKVPKDFDNIKKKFQEECKQLVALFPHLTFFGGNLKCTWEILHDFGVEEPQLIDRYSSTTSLFKSPNKYLRVIDDLWPWLYAHLYNDRDYNEWIKNGQPGWLFKDFIK